MAPLDGMREHLRRAGVPWEVVEDAASVRLVRDGVVHGCDICSRYRRRAVYETARRLNCRTIAFGHTADDFAEAMVRNLVFTGRVKPLPPVAISSRREFRLVRPLLYVREELIRAHATAESFPIVPCACSLKEGTRQVVRGFLHQVSTDNPHTFSNIIAAGIRSWRQSGKPELEDDVHKDGQPEGCPSDETSSPERPK